MRERGLHHDWYAQFLGQSLQTAAYLAHLLEAIPLWCPLSTYLYLMEVVDDEKRNAMLLRQLPCSLPQVRQCWTNPVVDPEAGLGKGPRRSNHLGALLISDPPHSQAMQIDTGTQREESVHNMMLVHVQAQESNPMSVRKSHMQRNT